MHRSAIARLISFGGLALAGLVGGHALGYAIALPDPLHRAAVIAETGHGYLPSVSWSAVVCGLAALIAGVAAGYLHVGSSETLRRTGGRVVFMQITAFVLIEIVERLASGASLGTLSPSLLVVGATVQLLVGLVVALLLVGLRRVGATIRVQLRVAAAAGVSTRLSRADVVVEATRPQAANRVRAPPAARAA